MALAHWTPCDRCGEPVRAADLRPLRAAWVGEIDDTAAAWLGDRPTVHVCRACDGIVQDLWVEDQRWLREAAASLAPEDGGERPNDANR
jgi:hypothetical protein